MDATGLFMAGLLTAAVSCAGLPISGLRAVAAALHNRDPLKLGLGSTEPLRLGLGITA